MRSIVARVSPNGKWLAYASGPGGGVFQIFVKPFSRGSGQWQVATGFWPEWRHDGHELFYFSGASTPVNHLNSCVGKGRRIICSSLCSTSRQHDSADLLI